MKKTVIAKIVAAMIILTASVTVMLSGPYSGTATPGGSDGPAEEQIMYNRLVINEKSLSIDDMLTITSATRSINRDIRLVNDTEPPIDGEIVFGNSSREITAKAKAAMNAHFEADGTGIAVGYLIYREGNNVAVYWTEPEFKATALDVFLTECLDKSALVLGEGIVYVSGEPAGDYYTAKYWTELEASGCDAETLAALKKLNAFYNGPAICNWMAGLWDPAVGGFYYSNSARDNDGFLPDLESTNQLTSWLVSNGATAGVGRSEFYPDWMKRKIIKFVKDMQCPSDGYFYHPQWPQGKENLATDRYGRDLSWATGMLRSFFIDTDGDGIPEKQHPNYCTPSGVKCAEHINGGQCNYSNTTLSTSQTAVAAACASAPTAITATLKESSAGAASKVMINNSGATVTATVSSKPDYSSPEAFTAWLWAYNGSVDSMLSGSNSSGRAHNLNALQSEIIGKGFGDELVAWLDEVQQQIWDRQVAAGETPTGVWQTSIDKRLVWGVLKYMPFYNSSVCGKKIELEKALAMVRACTKVIELAPDSKWALNDMMNQWNSINNIKSNVAKYYGAEGVEKIYEITRENITYRIENSIAKLEPYKLPDGTFVYTTSGKSPTKIYGVPISMGVPEGDVNGNSLVCSMYRGIFEALGYKVVPLCTRVDGELFLRRVEEIENSYSPSK